MSSKVEAQTEVKATWTPTEKEMDSFKLLMEDYIKGRNIIQKSYNQFNNRTLYDCIDDWQKRWNGYVVLPDIVDTNPSSRIFLNFTRNAIISWISKVAMEVPRAKIEVVNKKSGMNNRRMAEIFESMLHYSENAENYPARFVEAALEICVKGTGIVYESYAKIEQEMKIPDGFDIETGKGKFKKEKRLVYDDCFQKIVPIEDFYIANPYQPDIQKQPFIIWREITTYEEFKSEYGHYKNADCVTPGAYVILSEPTTFYRNKIYTELAPNQCEILRYYNRQKNRHIVSANGIVIYDGPIPFKDGKYPFARGIFEPYSNDFFWGMGFPNKIMGEQDLANGFFNMMVDKTYGSLLPYGLSSDLDDLIEDDILAPNKIRKVSDINKWKFDTLPSVNAAEQAMLQTTIQFLKENSGDLGGAGTAYSPKGGKLQVRQVMLRQQEMMQRLGYSINFLEEFEKDRRTLRLSHILQFYSIPKMERITGKNGKEIESLVYRDIKESGVKLSDGSTGNRIIKLTGELNDDERAQMADDLSVIEAQGELSGTPTEALAIQVDTLYDWNYDIQIVPYSSYEKNQALDQAARQEYANWRLSLAQTVPVDAEKLIEWVDESYDVDSDQFKPQQLAQPGTPGQIGMGGEMPVQQAPQGMDPAKQMAPIKPEGAPSMANAL
jgi:hypothetical protein